jgi:methionyl-tRNA formyltransferase
VRLLFAGTPEAAVPSLTALLDDPGHEVVAVLTRPPARSGRGRTMHDSPVADCAHRAGVPVLTPTRPSEPEFLSALADLNVDCAPVVAYGALLREPALSLPRIGWVNLHFSLLPAWRGAAPVQHAVLAGDEVTGASAFLLEEGLDSGPVYGTVTEQVRFDDTSGRLLERLSRSGARLLVATMDGIENGQLEPRPQPADGVSLAPKISVEDARVEWTAPALRVDRLVRGCTPAPGAWTLFRGERLKLGPVRLAVGRSELGPGEILVAKNTVRVGTGSHEVELGEVQPQGKKLMPAADWARGSRLAPAEHLGR